MKEDFLHYVWQYKKFVFSNLTTVTGEVLTIVHCGQYLKQAGPDFFNAQITIGDQKWAGNVEIHVNSSDWYLHRHEHDVNYDNVILHVVWEHDMPVLRKDNTEIPVLELKHYVDQEVLRHYQTLMTPKTWIYCENQIEHIDDFVLHNWLERMYFERLERKAIGIEQLLESTGNDWEAVLFCMLAKNFGLNTNGDSFLKMALAIPFHLIRKERQEVENLEALFLGLANLFSAEPEDRYAKDLKQRFLYMLQKYQLKPVLMAPVQFFKHRPDNFPTIRLAQLALLYHQQTQLFSKLLAAQTLNDCYRLFEGSVSDYWLTHYQLDKESPKKNKPFSKSFMDLLVVNTLAPIQFAYAKSLGKEIPEHLLGLLQMIAPEKNSIIEKFANFGVAAENAFETQSLLQLKNEYCNAGRCLECALGVALLKS
ncbi:DUF2851 family protein [Flavobacterium sp. XGLA_31]|uniref:DUF2851 family protein n=1 Tax=Flavobacterium sp. XGLA_31 TaxID=3447666 RepID=UPI003F3244DD